MLCIGWLEPFQREDALSRSVFGGLSGSQEAFAGCTRGAVQNLARPGHPAASAASEFRAARHAFGMAGTINM